LSLSVHWFDGVRAQLRDLFTLAEDSAQQLDAYIDDGRVLVAVDAGTVVGHLQLVGTRFAWALEVKNMAVLPERQRRGIGRALVERAARVAADEDHTTLTVLTAAADVDNLQFYQRAGFRMMAVERDVFTTATGYPDGLVANGIEVRDGVRLAMDLAQRFPEVHRRPSIDARVRAATCRDRSHVARMFEGVYDAVGLADALAFFDTACMNPGGPDHFALAELDERRPAGALWISERPWAAGCRSSPVAYVEGWYVDPAYRHGGVGAALMRHADRWAGSRGLACIGSDAEPHNAPSIAAHRALGFREVGTTVAFARDTPG
jgi:GNAT superfamily N-acetyltransferase